MNNKVLKYYVIKVFIHSHRTTLAHFQPHSFNSFFFYKAPTKLLNSIQHLLKTEGNSKQISTILKKKFPFAGTRSQILFSILTLFPLLLLEIFFYFFFILISKTLVLSICCSTERPTKKTKHNKIMSSLYLLSLNQDKKRKYFFLFFFFLKTKKKNPCKMEKG